MFLREIMRVPLIAAWRGRCARGYAQIPQAHNAGSLVIAAGQQLLIMPMVLCWTRKLPRGGRWFPS